jgi:hypothetical protein
VEPFRRPEQPAAASSLLTAPAATSRPKSPRVMIVECPVETRGDHRAAGADRLGVLAGPSTAHEEQFAIGSATGGRPVPPQRPEVFSDPGDQRRIDPQPFLYQKRWRSRVVVVVVKWQHHSRGRYLTG